MQSEFLAADNAEERGGNLFGKARDCRGRRCFSVENYVDEKRVVAAPILGETIIDAGDLRIVGKKLLKLFDSFPDFILLNLEAVRYSKLTRGRCKVRPGRQGRHEADDN